MPAIRSRQLAGPGSLGNAQTTCIAIVGGRPVQLDLGATGFDRAVTVLTGIGLDWLDESAFHGLVRRPKFPPDARADSLERIGSSIRRAMLDYGPK